MSASSVSLTHRQKTLFSALTSKGSISTSTLPKDIPAPILALQRQQIEDRMVDRLALYFQTTASLLGEPLFRYTARQFFAQTLPADELAGDQQDNFPYFLILSKAVAKYPYISDIAFLDLAYRKSECASDNCAVDTLPNNILNPSVFCISSAHPIVSVWHTRKACHPVKRLRATAENALVFRKAFHVHIVNIAPCYAYFLDSLLRGDSLDIATRFAHQLDPTFNAKATMEWMAAQDMISEKTPPFYAR